MSTTVETTVVVDVPLSAVYNQWTQFEDFPRFMSGVERVTQIADDRLEWVARIGGVSRQWEAQILEQVPDRKIAWAATEGALNAGTVSFEDAGQDRTRVHLLLEYEPEGLVETVGDKLHLVENRAQKDLERFKEFIEAQGQATGAWRGSVHVDADVGAPGMGDAPALRGDDARIRPPSTAGAGTGAAAGAVTAVETTSDDATGSEDAAWPPLATEGPTGTARAEEDAPAQARRADAASTARRTDARPLEEGPEGVVLSGVEDSTGQPAEDRGSPSDPTGSLRPIPPAGATEDLIPSTGAPRVDTDPDITDQPLDIDAPLDAEPPAAPPAGAGPFTDPPGAAEDTAAGQPPTADDMASPAESPQRPRVDAPLDAEPVPPLETPPVDMPDAAPAAGPSRVDPLTGRPVDENRPGGSAV
ncbi:SRPBCC family protein [Kocuria sp. CNJ-770]|uniref:SRPBCC family protein n=1 Tax=Kocuria sp. CNJ-770 TaxID=1904964 RepID=UPI0009FA4ADF